MRRKITVSALALGLSATAYAGAADTDVQAELQALKAKVEQQDKEIQGLRSSSDETWMNERRAEEIKSLIHEVLSDADTRASFQEGGLTAGWRDHFFLASEDGNFLMQLSGQAQTRYMYNNADNPGTPATPPFDPDGPGGPIPPTPGTPGTGGREHENGFTIRRAMLSFEGHLFDPKFTYQVSLLASDSDGLTESFGVEEISGPDGFTTFGSSGNADVVLQNAWFGYEFADGWQVKAGQFKAPFLRDELVHSSRQLAVERGWVTDLTTVDYTQGAQLAYNGELSGAPIRAAVMIHDGSYAANTDFTSASEAEIGIAARGEALLAGTWEQFDDYATFSGDAMGLLVGAAVDWEDAEGETAGTSSDLVKWTVDASAELPDLAGLSLFGAVIGEHFDGNETGAGDSDNFYFVAQAGVFVVPDKWDVFARFEYADLDTSDDIDSYTFGTNYYFQKHAAKFTLDVVWVNEATGGTSDTPPISALSTGSSESTSIGGGNGLLSSDDDQVAIRGQFQFLF